jgi:hypothetical protein
MFYYEDGQPEAKRGKLMIFVDGKQVGAESFYLNIFHKAEEKVLAFREIGAECRVTIDNLDP